MTVQYFGFSDADEKFTTPKPVSRENHRAYQSYYAGLAMVQPTAIAKQCADLIRRRIAGGYIRDFDTFAVSGLSGHLIGPTIAEVMGKHLTVVRKVGDKNHWSSCYDERSDPIVGYADQGSRALIIDDFISTGNTIRYIASALHDWHDMTVEGVIEYTRTGIDGHESVGPLIYPYYGYNGKHQGTSGHVPWENYEIKLDDLRNKHILRWASLKELSEYKGGQ
jgi:adenine/guanine phosphoribosyltransferase-like PRPP-binding protein